MFRILNQMTKAEAVAVLGIDVPFDEDQLKSVYRKRAISSHPDQGGSSEQFRLVKEAYELLKILATKVEKAYVSDLNRPCDCVDRGVKEMMTCKRCNKIEVPQPALKIKRKVVIITPTKQERLSRIAVMMQGKKIEKEEVPVPEEKARTQAKVHVEYLHYHLCPECGTEWECKDDKCDKKKVKTEEKCKITTSV